MLAVCLDSGAHELQLLIEASGCAASSHLQTCVEPGIAIAVAPVIGSRGRLSLREAVPVVCAFEGFLDNRPELLAELGRGTSASVPSDAELIADAFLKWGDAFASHLVGELVAIVWDRRTCTLTVVRDAVGARVAYYHRAPAGFMLCTDAGAIARTRGLRDVNRSRLFDFLMADYFDRDDQVGTLFAGIDRLPSGSILTVPRDGTVRAAVRYWHPERLSVRRGGDPLEWVESLRSVLDLAIARRVYGVSDVACATSGGLDSTTVTALTATIRARASQSPPVAINLRDDTAGLCHDGEAAAAAAAHLGIPVRVLRPADVTAESTTEFIDYVSHHGDAFVLQTGHFEWQMFRLARDAGCTVLLDGMAGDLLFWSVERSLRFIAREHAWRHWPAMRESLRAHHFKSPAVRLLASVLREHLPHWAKQPVWRLRDRATLRDALLRATFGAADAASLLRARQTPYRSLSRRALSAHEEHAAWFTSGLASFAHERYQIVAHGNGMEPRSPYSDRRVVEHALTLPFDFKLAVPRYKWPLREMGRGLLPDHVLDRSEIGYHPGHAFFAVLNRRICKRVAEAAGRTGGADVADGWATQGGPRAIEALGGSDRTDFYRACLAAWRLDLQQ